MVNPHSGGRGRYLWGSLDGITALFIRGGRQAGRDATFGAVERSRGAQTAERHFRVQSQGGARVQDMRVSSSGSMGAILDEGQKNSSNGADWLILQDPEISFT